MNTYNNDLCCLDKFENANYRLIFYQEKLCKTGSGYKKSPIVLDIIVPDLIEKLFDLKKRLYVENTWSPRVLLLSSVQRINQVFAVSIVPFAKPSEPMPVQPIYAKKTWQKFEQREKCTDEFFLSISYLTICKTELGRPTNQEIALVKRYKSQRAYLKSSISNRNKEQDNAKKLLIERQISLLRKELAHMRKNPAVRAYAEARKRSICPGFLYPCDRTQMHRPEWAFRGMRLRQVPAEQQIVISTSRDVQQLTIKDISERTRAVIEELYHYFREDQYAKKASMILMVPEQKKVVNIVFEKTL